MNIKELQETWEGKLIRLKEDTSYKGIIEYITDNGIEIQWKTIAPDGKSGGRCMYSDIENTLKVLEIDDGKPKEEKIKFIFQVDGLKQEVERVYNTKPSKDQIQNDIKEWFFNEYYMWFSIESDGKETNLEEF